MEINTDLFFKICFTCHKRPERSFHYKGKPFPICARCTGLGTGYILSFALLAIVGLFDWRFIPLLILPTVIDGGGQLLGKWLSNNSRRFVTGIFAGIGIFYLFFYYFHLAFSFGRSVGMKYF